MTFLTNLKLEPKGTHSSSRAYSATDVVTSADGSAAYAAVKDVPAGIALINTDYWVKILDLSDVRAAANAAASNANAAADSANSAANSGIRTDAAQNLNTAQKDTAQENMGLKEIIYGLTDGFELSGNPVQCNPVGGLAFDGVETQFSPKQAGDGDPSPQNIRPISGWESLNLIHCGKNLINPGFYVSSKTENGVTFTANADGTILMNGTATDTTMFDLFVGTKSDTKTYLQPHQAYTISFGSAFAAISGTARMAVGYRELTTDSWNYSVYAYGSESKTFTLPDGAIYTLIRIRLSAGDVCDNVLVQPQIELGSAATDFEAYKGEIYSVQIGETIYGGRMNWLTGELTAQWACDALDGTETISANAGDAGTASRYSVTLSNKAVEGYGYADRYSLQTWATKDYTFYPYTHGMMVVHPGLNDVDDFKSYLAAQYAAGTPVQIAYKLATPAIIQLAPRQIAAIQGVNTFCGDADAIAIAGRESQGIALEKRIAALEAA